MESLLACLHAFLISIPFYISYCCSYPLISDKIQKNIAKITALRVQILAKLRQLSSGRSEASSFSRKSKLSAHMVRYMCIKGSQLKYKLQYNGTWSASARALRRLCYRPTVFSRQVHLTAILFPQGKLQREFHKCYYFNFFFFYFLKFLLNCVSRGSYLQTVFSNTLYVYPWIFSVVRNILRKPYSPYWCLNAPNLS